MKAGGVSRTGLGKGLGVQREVVGKQDKGRAEREGVEACVAYHVFGCCCHRR